MTYNRAILTTAGQYLGEAEWPGAKHNPEILRMFEVSGHSWVQDDETPWCAAFVNMVLASLGLPHTGSLRARSYESYGTEIALSHAQPGDIVVLWRGTPEAVTGHVGFLVSFNGASVTLRGGNQRDGRVTDSPYALERIASIRRADGVASAVEGRPPLRRGDRGRYVTDLQEQLTALGFPVGAIDDQFGRLTEQAVIAFQKHAGLVVDGIVGPLTWAALGKAEPAPLRHKTENDLADSRTIQSANKAATVAGATVSIAGIGSVVEAVQDAQETLGGAETALAVLQRMLTDYWPALIVVVSGFVIWYYLRQIRAFRVEDAITGKHLGR